MPKTYLPPDDLDSAHETPGSRFSVGHLGGTFKCYIQAIMPQVRRDSIYELRRYLKSSNEWVINGSGLQELGRMVSPDNPKQGQKWGLLSTKITNICCQITVMIFTNQDLVIRDFLNVPSLSIAIQCKPFSMSRQIHFFLLLLDQP